MHPQPPWKGGSLREPQATPSRLDYCIFKPLDLFSSESGIGACASTPKDENNSTVRYRSLSRGRERARVRELSQHSIFKAMSRQRRPRR